MTLGRGLRQIAYTLALVALLKGCTSVLDAEQAVQVEVTPKIQLAGRRGGNVYVKLTLPRNALNRAVCVFIDGTMFRSTCFSLDGQRAAYREEWWVKELTEGRYFVEAVLVRSDGSEHRANDRFCISGDEGCF